MKLIKQASGKTTVKMSRSEWLDMGKKAGFFDDMPGSTDDFNKDFGGGFNEDNTQLPDPNNNMNRSILIHKYLKHYGKENEKWSEYHEKLSKMSNLEIHSALGELEKDKNI